MADPTEVDELGATPDERIVNQAKKRFQRCVDWERYARTRFVDDLKFANGDADNFYQWPNSVRQNRDIDEKPCVTVNRIRQHNLNVINDAKQNKPSIVIKPTGDGATLKAAQTFESVVRYIERRSRAHTHYDRSTTFQVTAGYGVLRVRSDYADDDSFDQELYIDSYRDPLAVYFDPDAKELDKSDGAFAFAFDDMPKDVFKEKWPRFADKVGQTALADGSDWLTHDYVRVAEYFRVIEKKDKLVQVKIPETGEVKVELASKIPAELLDMLMASDDPPKTRPIKRPVVEWFLIVADEIAERKAGNDAWPGKRIPLVPVIGEETIIEGQFDRKGHTRSMKDQQRIYNYYSSSVIEFAAAQTKTPYMAPVKAIEGVETYWWSSNTTNHAVLPWNHVDEDGQPIPPPVRVQPPMVPEAYIKGMAVVSDEFRQVTGQYQSDMGEPGNEKSGKAIQQRQRQGDTATYHFIDNLAIAIRSIGEILVDVIPHFYDTPRVLRIVAKDGTESDISLDPAAKEAHMMQQAQDEQAAKIIFNPRVGKYDVESDIGPAYATQRQEAFNAFTQILTQAPDLVHIIGDLMFMAADFPMAEQVAERLKRMVPPQALGGENPQVKAAAAEITKLQAMINHLTEQLAQAHSQAESTDAQKEIDIYKAVTDRLKVMLGTMVNPKDLAQMHHDLMRDEHGAQLGRVTSAMDANLGSAQSAQDHQEALDQSAQGHDQSMDQMAAQPAPEPAGAAA